MRGGEWERGRVGDTLSPPHPLSPSPRLEINTMRLIYVLLSPTFGMHQYTADLANRAAEGAFQRPALSFAKGSNVGALAPATPFQPGFERPDVSLVTTSTLPRDRYSPAVRVHTPIASRGTGFSREGFDVPAYRRALATIDNVSTFERSKVSLPIVHFTGVHLWNPLLARALLRQGIPVVHSLHNMDPHSGVRFNGLIRAWNRLIIGSGVHLLVHGRRYRDRLLAEGVPPERVTCVPLLHGFWGYESPIPDLPDPGPVRDGAQFPVPTPPTVLFFGRIEPYKGVDVLLEAWRQLDAGRAHLVIAGPLAAGMTMPALPPGVELRARRIDDAEAIALFRSASLLVLPYRDATQSALVAAGYAFGVPAIVTDAGALPEYVAPGDTGWVIPRGDASALAAALQHALAGPSRLRQMGIACRMWYDAQRQAEQTALADMYRALSASSSDEHSTSHPF